MSEGRTLRSMENIYLTTNSWSFFCRYCLLNIRKNVILDRGRVKYDSSGEFKYSKVLCILQILVGSDLQIHSAKCQTNVVLRSEWKMQVHKEGAGHPCKPYMPEFQMQG